MSYLLRYCHLRDPRYRRNPRLSLPGLIHRVATFLVAPCLVFGDLATLCFVPLIAPYRGCAEVTAKLMTTRPRFHLLRVVSAQ